MESSELGRAFLRDGQGGLEAVMREYGPALLRYCHTLLCDYHEAQDALQITFLKAYANRQRYREERPLSPWLYRIAYTTCVDLLRKKKLRACLPERNAGDGTVPEPIRRALMELGSMDRALVYGRIMEKRSYQELAALYGKSEAALRKRYERARKRLASRLRDDYPHYAKLEGSRCD